MGENCLNGLEETLAKIAGTLIGSEYVLTYNNFNGIHASGLTSPERLRWLPIENSYFGDVPEIFTAVLASGIIADKIEDYGKNNRNKVIEFIGRHFPALTSAIIGTYYTLGETVLPQLLPGTADSKDVPAVLITALASPFVANYIRKILPEWKQKTIGIIKKLEIAK
jgi:hypothetical protein